MTAEPDVNAFLKRYLSDLEKGTVLSLEEYQRLWPGAEDLVAKEFARLREPTVSTPIINSCFARSCNLKRRPAVPPLISRNTD